MTLLDFKVYQPDTDSIGDLTSHVGNTPLLPLRRIGKGLPPGVKVFAKAEWFNPGGSVKDRPALNILSTARGAALITVIVEEDVAEALARAARLHASTWSGAVYSQALSGAYQRILASR